MTPMRLFYKIPLRLRSLFRKSRVEQELTDELRFHLEKLIEEKVGQGMTPEEARYAALRQLGGVEQIKEECRDMRRVNYIENLFQDIRFGLRMLAKNPGFTAVAALTLALGIGANTSLFTLVDVLLLRPLPYKQANRLVAIWDTEQGTKNTAQSTTAPRNYVRWGEASRSFTHLALAQYIGYRLNDAQEPINGLAMEVTPNLFEMLGVSAAVGRAFAAGDERASDSRIAVFSYGLWQRQFGADPQVVGRSIRLNDQSFTVLGIMPSTFQFPPRLALTSHNAPDCCDLWVPLLLDDSRLRAPGKNYFAYGRLKAGVSLPQAQAEMDAFAPELAKQFPDLNYRLSLQVGSLSDLTTRQVRPALLVLLGAVGLILLIACANIANLLLARAASRSGEIAIRAALGASRSRLLRQFLTESVLLGNIGGLAGLGLAHLGLNALLYFVSVRGPYPVRMDPTVLAFTLALSLLTSLLFGSAAAWPTSPGGVRGALAEAGRTGSGGTRLGRIRGAFTIAEVALSLIVLVGAGLLLRTLWVLLHVDPGFQAEHVLTMDVGLPTEKYPSGPRAAETYAEILERVRHLSGVLGAGATQRLPIVGQPYGELFQIEGRPMRTLGDLLSTQFFVVTPDYFATMQIPIRYGRYLSEQDSVTGPCAMVVNETLARRYFPQGSPIGRRITFEDPQQGPWCPVVGVVADVRHFGLAAEVTPQVYVSYRQYPKRFMTLVVRSQGDSMRLAATVQSAVRSFDKDLTPEHIATMAQLISMSLSERRLNAVVLGLLAGLALLLAAVGIYGVISYMVVRRTHEIGIRMALGAKTGDVQKMVIGNGIKLALVGVGIGIVGALALTRFLSSLLFGVQPADPATFVVVSVVLTAVALAASYVPARRATKVDPMVALRYE